jgi:hypothetical protein
LHVLAVTLEGEPFAFVWDVVSGRRLLELDNAVQGQTPVSDIVFSPDGRHLGTVSSQTMIWKLP